jgi:hypothetical protein
MLWRAVTALLILFWAVMTGLLLRDVYFPDHSAMAEVPPKLVLDLFLDQASLQSNTLHVYRKQEKLGHANFNVVRSGTKPGEVPLYRMTASGGVDTKLNEGQRVTAGWRLDLDLRDGTDLEGLKLDMTSGGTDQTVLLRQKGQEVPLMEVRQGSRLVMDTKGALALAGWAQQGGLLGQVLGDGAGPGQKPQLTVQAREGLMDLAGKPRRCFVVLMTLFGLYEIQALFTEVGELARVDLPQEVTLKEPLIHGLEPDLIERDPD